MERYRFRFFLSMTQSPPPRTPLYRPEAVAHQRERAWGELIVTTPWVAKLLLWTLLLLAAGFVLFLTQAEYTRKARASALISYSIDPTLVAATEAGVLTEIAVKEGDRISAGQLLATISTERTVAGEATFAAAATNATDRRVALDSERRELTLQLSALEAQSVSRLRAIEIERVALGKEIEAQNLRVAQLQSQLDRFRELAKNKFVSELQVQQKQDEWTEQVVKVETLRRSDATLARELAKEKAELPVLLSTTRTRIAALDRDRALQAQTAREDTSRRGYEVRASSAGVIERIIAVPGQTLASGGALMRMQANDSVLLADVFVPTRAAGFLREGQAVRLAVDAFPFERFGHVNANITQIGRVVLIPGEPGVPAALREPAFRVRAMLTSQEITAYGERFPLKNGLAAQADIALDTRPLYRWVIEPILRLRGSL
jgi:membrane fusion protein